MGDAEKSLRAETVLAGLADAVDATRRFLEQQNAEAQSGASEPSSPGEIAELEFETKELRERLRILQTEKQEFARRIGAIEEEHTNLANLYTAMYQIHSARTPQQVVGTVAEILSNQVGADCFAIYLYDARSGQLDAAAVEGAEAGEFPAIASGDGPIWRALREGEVACSEREGGDAAEAPVIVALRVEERPIGAVVIRKLVENKCGFGPLDHELFRLLAVHAAGAILSTRLYSVSERKRATMHALLDLLTK
jgi:hypothetical protein